MDIAAFGQYGGLVGLMIGAILLIFFFIIRENLKQTERLIAQAAKEREIFYSRMAEVNTSIIKVCDILDNHDRRAEERGRYVKEEHEKMVKNLAEINSSSQATVRSLTQVEQALGRINGYKHD
jgi:hypothetical protein